MESRFTQKTYLLKKSELQSMGLKDDERIVAARAVGGNIEFETHSGIKEDNETTRQGGYGR